MTRKSKKEEDAGLLLALRENLRLLGELAVRYEVGSNPKRPTGELSTISSPWDVRAIVGAEMAKLAQEQLRLLLLDIRHHVVGQRVIYQGTVDSCAIRPAEVLRPAVLENAPRIIIVHNHPSGDPSPSGEDRNVTRELIRASKLLGIELLDHVVIGGDSHASLKDLGCFDY